MEFCPLPTPSVLDRPPDCVLSLNSKVCRSGEKLCVIGINVPESVMGGCRKV